MSLLYHIKQVIKVTTDLNEDTKDYEITLVEKGVDVCGKVNTYR